MVTVINCVAWCIFSSNSLSFLHEGLVISSYFLYVDVELSVNIRFGCRVTIGDSDDAGDVLEVIVIFYLHLEQKCQYLSRLSISARWKKNRFHFWSDFSLQFNIHAYIPFPFLGGHVLFLQPQETWEWSTER